MLKVKALGAVILLGTLAGTGSAIAGGPGFEFPSPNQCLHFTNEGRTDFAVLANTSWDKCREAYRRSSGVVVTISGKLREHKTGRHQNVSTIAMVSPNKVARPLAPASANGWAFGNLSAKDYVVDGSFSVTEARWIHK